MPNEEANAGIGPEDSALGVATLVAPPVPPKRIPQSEDARIVAEYAAGRSQSAIAAEFGVKREAVRSRLRRLGVPADVDYLRYRKSLDHLAFSVVTPESAYWAGFLMADGCVTRPAQGQARISLRLAEVDRGHVEKFRAFVGSGRKISTIHERPKTIAGTPVGASTSAHLGICSDRVADDLARFGVVPRKSTRETVLLLDKNKDFWRGYVDGDGSLRVCRPSSTSNFPVLDLVGSHSIVSQFATYVMSLVPTSKLVAGTFAHSPVTGRLSISSWTAVAVVKNLYDEAEVYLDRKMDRAKEILGWAAGRRKGSPVNAA